MFSLALKHCSGLEMIPSSVDDTSEMPLAAGMLQPCEDDDKGDGKSKTSITKPKWCSSQ